MQFHANGYRTGDPGIRPAAPHRRNRQDGTLPQEVDVLVVGTGPAGLVLAAQLAEFPEISTLVVERDAGPLQLGHADGVACRTLETLNAFGLADRLVREGHWVNEAVFWRPDAGDRTRITRSGRVQDVADGLSEYPHVIINQARLQDFLLEHMRHSPSRLEPDYGLELVDVAIDAAGGHPVHATVRRTRHDGGIEEIAVRAKYVVGCDGARSAVRRSIGAQMHGDARNHAWGVLDILATTDFPDIRFKAAIQSADGGNILLIPREGGHLVRLYVDLGQLDPADREARRRFTAEQLIETAQRILHPYTLDVREVAWWSVYEVGQRIADRFDDVLPHERGTRSPRAFIAGDACHTHSAKAGQGMNVSIQDGFNLGWKLAAVLRGHSPASLLDTYAAERQVIARELIDFDIEWSRTMGAKPADPEHPEAGGVDPAEVQRQFVRAGRFTAGFGTRYTPSMLTGGDTHQHLASGFPVGERFQSAPVRRVADARPVGLGHVARADGRWRLYLLADAARPEDGGSAASGLLDFLATSERSPLRGSTAAGGGPQAAVEVLAVYQQGHRDVSVDHLHPLLLPATGALGLTDYEKAFTADPASGTDIFDVRGIDRSRGALIVVRPDQYVSHVLPLDAHDELSGFFEQILRPAVPATA